MDWWLSTRDGSEVGDARQARGRRGNDNPKSPGENPNHIRPVCGRGVQLKKVNNSRAAQEGTRGTGVALRVVGKKGKRGSRKGWVGKLPYKKRGKHTPGNMNF